MLPVDSLQGCSHRILDTSPAHSPESPLSLKTYFRERSSQGGSNSSAVYGAAASECSLLVAFCIAVRGLGNLCCRLTSITYEEECNIHIRENRLSCLPCREARWTFFQRVNLSAARDASDLNECIRSRVQRAAAKENLFLERSRRGIPCTESCTLSSLFKISLRLFSTHCRYQSN